MIYPLWNVSSQFLWKPRHMRDPYPFYICRRPFRKLPNLTDRVLLIIDPYRFSACELQQHIGLFRSHCLLGHQKHYRSIWIYSDVAKFLVLEIPRPDGFISILFGIFFGTSEHDRFLPVHFDALHSFSMNFVTLLIALYNFRQISFPVLRPLNPER